MIPVFMRYKDKLQTTDMGRDLFVGHAHVEGDNAVQDDAVAGRACLQNFTGHMSMPS